MYEIICLKIKWNFVQILAKKLAIFYNRIIHNFHTAFIYDSEICEIHLNSNFNDPE